MLRQVGVGLRKMMVSEEATMGRQRRRMRRREHKMPRAVDKRAFLDGISTPKQKHQMLACGSEMRNHGVGKRFPTMTLM